MRRTAWTLPPRCHHPLIQTVLRGISMLRCLLLSLVFLTLCFTSKLGAEDASPSSKEVRAAVEKSLPLLVQGAKGSMEQRKQCFTCHNQGFPVMALTAARARGFEVDEEHLQSQLKFIADFLGKNKARYLEGNGQGGQVDTAGFALWTLDAGGCKASDTTAAVAEYFLLYQKEMEHYKPSSRRPPSEQSLFTSSFVALRSLKVFGTEEQKERIDQRVEKVREWILSTAPEDTEDHVFRLRALKLVEAADDVVQGSIQALVKLQRDDGGWAQLAEMESDPYATGTALMALHDAGGMNSDQEVYRKGLRFLLQHQKEDGSWHVVSRAKPFQKHFESGYPHGKDQFISMAAASWATMALLMAEPTK